MLWLVRSNSLESGCGQIMQKNYPLKIPMDCMVLFFVDSCGKLFTTIRRSIPTKAEYYNTSIGCDFELVIE